MLKSHSNSSKQAVAGMTLLQGAPCRDPSRLLASACSCRPRGLPSGPRSKAKLLGRGGGRVLGCLGIEWPPWGGTDTAECSEQCPCLLRQLPHRQRAGQNKRIKAEQASLVPLPHSLPSEGSSYTQTELSTARLAKSHQLGRTLSPGDELSHPLPLHAAALTACKGTAELLNGLETSLMVKCQHISRLIKPGAWEERERRLAVLEAGMHFTARDHFKARKYFFVAEELQI